MTTFEQPTSNPRTDAWRKGCSTFVFYLIALSILAMLDVIDFHVCIKDAGHCKIIDPTKYNVVAK